MLLSDWRVKYLITGAIPSPVLSELDAMPCPVLSALDAPLARYPPPPFSPACADLAATNILASRSSTPMETVLLSHAATACRGRLPPGGHGAALEEVTQVLGSHSDTGTISALSAWQPKGANTDTHVDSTEYKT